MSVVLRRVAGLPSGAPQRVVRLVARGKSDAPTRVPTATSLGVPTATYFAEASRALSCSSDLSKARLSGFVAMTATMGFAATGVPVLTPACAAATYGVFATSAAANALNQAWEAPRDARMARTARRPLPSGRCTTPEALAFAAASAGTGVAALYALSAPAAALAAANIALYAGAYTGLKPVSEANTWVGAVVGAVPPLIGWSAAGGALVGGGPAFSDALAASELGACASFAATLGATPAEPWLLAGALYLWQFPHFFALAWVHKVDYAKGGFAMVPVNDACGRRTANLVSRYAAYSTALPFLAYGTGATSSMFVLEGGVLNAVLLAAAYRFHRKKSTENARTVFRVTLAYLPLLLFFFVLHSTRLRDGVPASSGAGPTLGDAVRPLRDLGRALCVHEIHPSTVARKKTDDPAAHLPPSLCPVAAKPPGDAS